ncbi:MAG: Lsr2 family protein [Cellulomonadaceae bacterium]|nr:Lsr2 family protein [Cellulomonadaceae bacterium]
MARETRTYLIDDIDGGEATQTVTFALDGVTYEIDLNDHHAQELRDYVAHWTAHARKAPKAPSAPAVRRTPARSGNAAYNAKVRTWAIAEGLKVSKRGRIGADVLAAYEAAH